MAFLRKLPNLFLPEMVKKLALAMLESTHDIQYSVYVIQLIILQFLLKERTIHFRCFGLLEVAIILQHLMMRESKRAMITILCRMLTFANFLTTMRLQKKYLLEKYIGKTLRIVARTAENTAPFGRRYYLFTCDK